MKKALKIIHWLFLLFVFFWILLIFWEKARVDPFTGNYWTDILILSTIELFFWWVISHGVERSSEKQRGKERREEPPPWAD